ncbi:bifunctional preprotein translocase subunit SecD/SecF [Pseudovibrio sp. FO-BEG1]|uniref:Protein-export membrane protein SecF n=2 Tax=Pseudovibrio TaxID=258255 RepID=A0A1I6XC11_9HYPH|nr:MULTISPECIES: protein translocase subunit SecF [Pseudovibrio]AEV37738.1 bifunctional preprotein translocase subunit SecD/SecF [Pseudovibrio sp. FO-BEG1]EEA96353.1 protein-export membrane protein SecF [Pseudovibrio sp. JE062]QUS53987.1 protein translocase subunit SecF [Pseudovibrio brasiliensis]SFT35643.1 protein translocase subunit secF [Pseudovibrio denitrificans]
MKLLRLVPEQTNFRFMHWRVLSFPFSGITAVLSIVLFLTVGLNYGIDFKGGTLIELQSTNGPANLSEIRRTLGGLNLGDVQVQEFGSPTEVLIRIESQGEGESAQQDVVENVRSAFTDGYEFRRTEVVGPRVSGELAYAGTLAVGSALLMIMFYIWFRFEWQFAVGAIITTFNDILLTVGLFAILQLDFTLSSIAAVLTIIGYSLNDTVVVYDRIRENLRRYKRLSLEELLDKSINETLSRTTMTSVTTLLALFALYFLGGEVIQSFVLAMIFGIVIGTYSSIFLASPLLMLMKLRTSVFDKKDDETSPAKSA